MRQPDAIVVGSGPNGLAAAIVIARAGRSVLVLEAADTIGGGCRSAALTLPGFTHDVCSAIHPLGVASPLFRALPLSDHGLEWIEPPAMVAHPFDDGSAAIVYRSLAATADRLASDGKAYRAVVEKLVGWWPAIEDDVLAPLGIPQHPLTMARFGWQALQAARPFGRRTFGTPRGRGLFAGIAAHSMLPLDMLASAAVGLVLMLMAHREGWVFPRGGAQRLADALAGYLRSIGGEIETGVRVESLDNLPPARAVLLDLSPRPILQIAGTRLPVRYRKALERYRYGMSAFKVDWALDGPVPWRNADCSLAATVHVGGSIDEIASSEQDAWNGRHAEQPFVLLTQTSLFDGSRAPLGKQTVWAYCHVPHGSDVDMLPRIEEQIERFAPGFRDRVIGRSVMRPSDIARHNANLVGGDIGMGVSDLRQLFARPTWRTYSTPVRGLYICSASTPPGVGVHGMCGYHAARRALREVLR